MEENETVIPSERISKYCGSMEEVKLLKQKIEDKKEIIK